MSIMLKRWKEIVSFLSTLLLPLSVYAYSSRFCPQHKTEVIIDNQVTPDRLQYDYSKSVPELTQMSKQSGGNVLGLFISQVGYGMKIDPLTSWIGPAETKVKLNGKEVPIEDLSSGKLTGGKKYRWMEDILKISPGYKNNGCVEKITVNVRVLFESPTIHVGREFLEGTDAYNYVQWHENEHARITIENNKRYLPYLEQELRRYINGLQLYIPETEIEWDNNVNYVRSKIEYIIKREMNNLNNYIREANGYFDFKEQQHSYWVGEEYKKVKEQ